ncbi:DNA internalization-related competence protein ComEC/Rec2 [Bacillus suaedaesalsae]|uniref:DNA internalization-related competence protein ComEC/Rec2 n=1 Tax=Bacillus suaedaesalsae TaxID=2810349 RepID=A0ABS2DL67_9BACI|nr:DNA internalization-related competence protein ComEC/Rec2 [Bacillus suaedaesalsae]MBM6619232.1 DNA internalization-related competence protein ComEC/Rec2 [Bacillus suaedaesalsae]
MQNQWIYLACFSLFGIVFIHLRSPLFLLIVTLIIVYLAIKNRKLAITCCVIFVGFSIYYHIHNKGNSTTINTTKQHFQGKIVSRPVINGDQLRFIFKLNHGETLYFTYKLQSEEEKEHFSLLTPRQTCVFNGHVISPKEARNYYIFDFKQYLFRNHIHWMVEPTSFSVSHCKNADVSILDHIHIKRHTSLTFIETYFPSPLNGFIQALIFGERGLLEEDTLQSYQDLGLVHLLAISGMHVSLLCAFAYLLFVRIGLTKEKTIFTLMLILPIYVIVAGATPSVIRASIMTFLLLLKLRFRNFPLAALDLISLAFIMMVIANPYYIFQAGFQFSFIVTLALILSSKTILQKYSSIFAQMLSSSVVAQVSSLPFVLFHFYQFSLLSIPLNIIYIPIITFIILPMSMMLFFTSMISTRITNLIMPIANELLKLINQIAIFIANSDWQLLVLGRPGGIVIFLYTVFTIFTFLMWEKEQMSLRNTFIPLLLLLAFHWCFPYISPKGEITFIDVGQGDSILIELPFRKEVYLIDTGGMILYEQEDWKKKKDPYSISKEVIIPYLKGKGIRKIDKLIITHADLDHAGESITLLENMEVSEVMLGELHEMSQLERQIMTTAKKEKVEVKRVKRGDEWTVSDSTFRVLSPDKTYVNQNEGSIVLETFLGGRSWLFTGDIEKEAENNLIKNYPNLKTDVLKVAHHGSRTSTSEDVIKQLKPKVAIISVGVGNRYNHPNKEVLERLGENGVKVLRTDQLGAIRYTFFHNQKGTFQSKIPYDIKRTTHKRQ